MILKSLKNGIKNNKGFLRYFNNTLWLYLSKVLSLISTVFIGAWVAKYLGTEKYGLLSYSNSLVSLFLPLAMIGLNDVIVKELISSKDRNRSSTIITSALGLKVLFGFLSFLILVIFLLFNKDLFQVKILVLVFSTFLIIQSLEVFDFYFQSQVKSKYVVFSRVFAITVSAIFKVYLITIEANILYFASAIVLELFITHFITFLYFKKNKIKIGISYFNKEYAKSLVKRSWPLFLSGLMYIFYIKIDQIMVKEILGAHSVGLYAVAINLSEVWYFIPNIIAASFFPAILASKNKGETVYFKSLKNLYSFLFWIAILIAIFITFFGEIIINLLYDKNFYGASTILNIYIWSNVFYFFTTISSKWLVAEGLYLHSFYRNLTGVIFNVILNYVLLQKIGVIGAAISTLISYAMVGLFYDLFFKRLRINFKLKLKSILFLD